MKYNENITIDFIEKKRKLEPSEYYVLMVVDERSKTLNLRPKSDYFKYDFNWIGLEQTSDGKIYISKCYGKRVNYERGIPMIADVKDVSKCCIL